MTILCRQALYTPLLRNLEAAGYLHREDRVVDGRIEARAKVLELVDEVMQRPGASPATRRRVARF